MRQVTSETFVTFFLHGNIASEVYLHAISTSGFMQPQPLRYSSFHFVQDILCLDFIRGRQSFFGRTRCLNFAIRLVTKSDWDKGLVPFICLRRVMWRVVVIQGHNKLEAGRL